ncbi:MAG: hydrogenase subunit MbhD domain-containing protein, partial [Clostridia bacterium]
MAYSLVMSITWVILESPDLAITEAAVGAGVTSVLFFVTLKKIHLIKIEDKNRDENEKKH